MWPPRRVSLLAWLPLCVGLACPWGQVFDDEPSGGLVFAPSLLGVLRDQHPALAWGLLLSSAQKPAGLWCVSLVQSLVPGPGCGTCCSVKRCESPCFLGSLVSSKPVRASNGFLRQFGGKVLHPAPPTRSLGCWCGGPFFFCCREVAGSVAGSPGGAPQLAAAPEVFSLFLCLQMSCSSHASHISTGSPVKTLPAPPWSSGAEPCGLWSGLRVVQARSFPGPL